MAVILALISAASYGVSDFLGGLFSKRSGPWQIATIGQSSSALTALAAGLFVLPGSPTPADLVWGAAAGMGGGIGASFLYRGLAGAKMNVVAPLSAIGSALLPVAAGIGLGDRPPLLTALGVACAFPAIFLISRATDEDPTHRGGVADGIIAGLGFGFLFICLGQVSSSSGMLPIAALQTVSVLTVIVTASSLKQRWKPRDPMALRALLMGPLGVSATGCFMYATHHGLLSVVSVISALYPASTVALAAIFLRERVRGWQGVGLALAVASVTMVAAG